MKQIHIKDKLEELGVVVEDIILGHFDFIGEYTAKKSRDNTSELYKKVGCFFRPNYERGILIYHLIRKYNLKSFLEIGFGRGYGTMCAAMAFADNGGGKITTIDPELNGNHIMTLRHLYPQKWFNMIEFVNKKSCDVWGEIDNKYDFIYIDGDYTYEGVKNDWDNCKDRFNNFLLFDDYHLPSKKQEEIAVARLVDDIDDESKELIIMDRRIFYDDRGYTDDEIDYGQVLLSRKQ